MSSRHHPLPVPYNQFHSLAESHYKAFGMGKPRPGVAPAPFHHSLPNACAFQRFGFSSVPSPGSTVKENSPAAKGASTVENNGAKANTSGDAEAPEQREVPVCEDSLKELTIEDQVKQVTEKIELLKGKLEEIEKMQDKVQRTCEGMIKVAEKDRQDTNYAAIMSSCAIGLFPIMSLSKISTRFPRIVLAQCRNSFVISTGRHRPLPVPSNQFHSLVESRYKVLRH
ncbi:hypothetical protein RHSIM_RhsimUnG0247900 [Rhododendron simsii]|uniref:Uncharacterized protein n=1 Tax=Rhododendron simsii TaxID=118357 RepID=A0A834L3K6_RHOSS|nr:hypothetical protein RHSIM_RhsimUnG0247900 [Rhododendron simsii]